MRMQSTRQTRIERQYVPRHGEERAVIWAYARLVPAAQRRLPVADGQDGLAHGRQDRRRRHG